MARFIGYVHGAREPMHRIGGASSGLSVNACGWNIGTRAELSALDSTHDSATLTLHGGTNQGSTSASFGTWTEPDLDKLRKLPLGAIEAAVRALITGQA